VASDERNDRLTNAQCLFMGINSASDVPESIRNCWAADSPPGADVSSAVRTMTPAIAIPAHTTPEKLCPNLTNELGRIGDGQAAPAMPARVPSTFISCTSEDISETTGGLPGGSWNPSGVSFPYTDTATQPQRTVAFNPDSIVSRSAARGAVATGGYDSFVNSPSMGSHYSSMWGGHSMWSGGAVVDSALEESTVDPVAVRMSSSHLSEHSNTTGNVWGPHGMPAGVTSSSSICMQLGTSRCAANYLASPPTGSLSRILPQPLPPHRYLPTCAASNGSAPMTPGSAASSLSSRPFAPTLGAATNYAAVLCASSSAPTTNNSSNPSPSPLQPQPHRQSQGPSEETSPENGVPGSASHAALIGQLDAVGREVYGLLWPPWIEHVLTMAQTSLSKVPSRTTRADVNQHFLAAVNHCIVTKEALSGLLDKVGPGVKKQVMLAGGTVMPNTGQGPSINSLKQMVRLTSPFQTSVCCQSRQVLEHVTECPSSEGRFSWMCALC
jgi:hypothetical protein